MIGIACRLPGANDVRENRQLLQSGAIAVRSSARSVSVARISA
ncbi:hypothetical protein KEC55_30800 [Burkholderia cepacia]|nr:hypothetical protein KEC55_30800 [Burkholderia cepacia]